MLSSVDANLVRRNSTLIDLATLLQSHLHKNLQAVRSTYLDYKLGNNCSVACELDVGETTIAADAITAK